MNCPYCSTSNLDNASICVNCGRSLSAGAPPPPPPSSSYAPPPSSYTPPGQTPGQQIPNYLWQSIVVTLCCCLPLGIVGIIFAAQVNDKLGRGDIAGAMESSRQAKMFCWIAFGLGLVLYILLALFYGAVIIAALNEAANNR